MNEKRSVACQGLWTLALLLMLSFYSAHAQSETEEKLAERLESLEERFDRLGHTLSMLQKGVDDILWQHKVGDIAWVDKIRHVGPPRAKEPNPTAQGAGNPVKFYSYVFIPKSIDRTRKYPLLVFPHGGVHSNFGTYYHHIVRELLAQGYILIASEYRGSTGYGKDFYEMIDYGGLETEDVHAGRDYMLNNYSFIDPQRIGILGWSHGGLITLFNIFNHPEDYRVAYAGVPVSDLVARMGYKTQRYRDLYSVEYHIGQTAHENVEEYRRRSPAWHAEKLQTPLLIHTNTNDEDVNVLEVEHLIKSLNSYMILWMALRLSLTMLHSI